MRTNGQKVLILDLAVDPDMYRPTAHWRALLGETPSVSVALVQGDPMVELDGFTHLIVTGSEASVLDHAAWFDPAQEAIRDAVARGLPVLGSCFGHQLVVRALHGPAHLRRSAQPELGWFPVEVTGPDAKGPLGNTSPIWMFCFHFDEVFDLAPPYRVLAQTADCAVHAYRYGDAPVWGVQGHPEISPNEGEALLRAFATKLTERADPPNPAEPAAPPNLAEILARGLAQSPRDDGFGAVLTRRFLEMS